MIYMECKIGKELISDDWETIINRMIDYKRKHFPQDRRIITSCGFTYKSVQYDRRSDNNEEPRALGP